MRIGIIGLGYVGLTLAIAAADHGSDVYGIEIDPRIKKCLGENRAHFFEPGLDALIRRHNGKSFHCVDTFTKDMQIDVFVITVGTPLIAGKETPNFDHIRSAIESIKSSYDGTQLVILRSTVSVGTTRSIVMPLLMEMSGRSESDIYVAMCPERTVEGKAVEELTHLPQIVSGNNEAAIETAQKFFRSMTPYVIPVSSLEEAELVKLYCNTYRDMSFAIGNAFCIAAQEFGVDGISVIKHANQGYSRANIALPGFVAGPCLEKDAYILTNNMPECGARDFIMGGRKLNESLEDMVVEWVKAHLGDPSDGKTVALSGMAFKGQPETSDLRGSSSVNIAKKLKTLGYKMNLHDFSALPSEMEALELGTVYSDIYSACADAFALVILNNHKKYADIKEDLILSGSRDDFSILDCWDMCRELRHNTGINVYSLGDFMINRSEGQTQ